MGWAVPDIAITELSVTSGSNQTSDAVVVEATGRNFAKGIALVFVRDGVGTPTPADIIPANDVTIIEGNFKLSFDLLLSGRPVGEYNLIAWNPPLDKAPANEVCVLERAFRVSDG